MNPILIQTLYGLGIMLFTILIISFFMRGFFWKFMRVRASLGKLVLIKIRGIQRDFWSVGSIDQTFLIFKEAKEEGRVAIQDNSVFYKCLGIIWVDYDSATGGLVKPDFSTITGFDFRKFQNLYLRCLYKPTIQGGQERIMFILLIICIIAIIIIGILVYQESTKIDLLQTTITALKTSTGTIHQATI